MKSQAFFTRSLILALTSLPTPIGWTTLVLSFSESVVLMVL